VKLLTTHKDLGREVWIHYDKDAEVYELFASADGDDYLGCADTIMEARFVAQEWFEDLMAR
jgi:hypothetical protein